MQLRQAQRQQAKIKMGIQGPSGSGKTYSALLLAYGITQDWQKIVVIDSENNSADLYSHLGHYKVLPISRPFSPEHYIQAIEICEEAGMEVIIIDSISQEWEGQGGILEVHGNMTGNSFTNWNKVTPRHNAFVQKMLQSPSHIIATVRSKQDYVLSEKNGKYVPEKVGLRGVTREGLDYEFTIVFDIDIKHNTKASKDRTGLFMDKPEFIISPKTGIRIKNWCMGGISLDEVITKAQNAKSLDEFNTILQKHPQFRERMEPYIAHTRNRLNRENKAIV